jgi:hypothetical protein
MRDAIAVTGLQGYVRSIAAPAAGRMVNRAVSRMP